MKNTIISIFAVLLLFLGLLATLSPLPIGLLMISVSLSTLVCVNPRACQALKWLRTRYHSLHLKLLWIEQRLGRNMDHVREAFSKTHPDV